MTYRRTKKTKNRNKNIKRIQIMIGDLFRYCDENNIGITDKDSYKALNSYVKIRKIFESHYFSPKKDRTFDELLEELQQNKKYLMYLYKLHCASEKDFRTGEESYGYNTQEYIEERMSYISDRWNCAFRIRWILDLLDLNKKEIK